MVYIRIQITNGRNIARSFFPLIRLCASKKRGSYISSINVNEAEEWKRTWRQIRVNIVRNVKHFLFFSTRLLTELLAKASPSTRIFSVRASIPAPGFAIRRFDTVARCFRTPATFLLLPPSARNRRENKRGQEVTQWRWPTYTPTIFPSVPAISSLLYDSPPFPRPPRAPQFYFLSAATRSPILIKRISRHQFRVPWSPRDINYGRQYTRRASYVCRFEYR